jgi:hypothetical protein
MDELKTSILNLTRVICRLHRRRVRINDAIETLRNEGFETVLPSIVKAIYDRLSIEAEKFKKRCRDKADKSFFYSAEIKIDEDVDEWSERYLISYESILSDSTLHQIEVLDMFNDKSM